MNSMGLQTEVEIELESSSKYMGTNSCKYKYSIYTDFCSVSVITSSAKQQNSFWFLLVLLVFLVPGNLERELLRKMQKTKT